MGKFCSTILYMSAVIAEILLYCDVYECEIYLYGAIMILLGGQPGFLTYYVHEPRKYYQENILLSRQINS